MQTEESVKRPLRIAVVSQHDVRDVLPLSGSGFFMIKALERQAAELVVLGPVSSKWTGIGEYFGKIARLIGKGYDHYHSIRVSQAFGREFQKRLRAGKYDVIFAPMASTEIAFLDTEVPVVYLSDMTFNLARSYYSFFSNLLPVSEREGATVESGAVHRAQEIVVPSAWAAQSFRDDYNYDESRLNIIPFGANLSNPPSREDALRLRSLEVCRLLLVGVDWERKGGPIALGVLEALLAAGVNAELVVCGCKPPAGTPRTGVRVVPFLRKDDPGDANQLRELFLSSSFLIVPSKADAAPIVFAEASAYGLPSLTRQTGGTATMVRDGLNGFCLPADAPASEYAALILVLIDDPDRYRALCVSSRNEYESRLNWDNWAKQMMDVFTRACKRADN